MQKEKNKKKESNKTSIFVALFLVVLLGLLGFLAYSKYVHTPSKDSITSSVPTTSNLVEGNTFSLNGVICKDKSETECSKELKVSYKGQNHMIKIKRYQKASSTAVAIKNELYIDDKLVDTIDGGATYESNKNIDMDFDGYIYIGESKYLIIVTPFMVDKQTNYVVNYYENQTKLGKGIDIINGEQTICKGLCKDEEILNDLEALEFDGKVLKYWKAFCTQKEKEALQIGITIENQTITTKYLNTDKNVEIKGACN